MVNSVDSIYDFFFPRPQHRFHWAMGISDRIGLRAVLERIRPDVALEIGTHMGGSLEVITQYSRKALSIDINPQVANRLRGDFADVDFLVGDSAKMIEVAFQKIRSDRGDLQFVLIDGDHSEIGARKDIDLVLQYVPRKPMCIVIHDSFNPAVRQGILSAAWASNRHVHFVEVDYIAGEASVDYGESSSSHLWGGLALGVLLPQPRGGDLQISTASEEAYECLRNFFDHR